MKILFINPVTNPKVFKVQLNFGIAYLSAVLKERKHKTDLLTLHKINTKNIYNKIKTFNPDIIAISTVSDQFELAKKVISLIHHRYKKIPIIFGGIHPTIEPEECIELKGVKGVLIGEGERAFLEFVELYKKRKDYTKIKNFWFNFKGKIIKNPIRPLIQDLDSLPFPDRELFDVNTSDEIEFITSRGCPYQCSYCINKVMQDLYKGERFVRFRSVDNLLKEIESVLKRYKSPKILFHDDTFTLNKKWLKEFSKKYSKRIGLPFIANGRIETIDEEIIKLLKKANCAELKLGIESGNERIRREVLNRNMTNNQIINVFKLCKKHKILTNSFNMIGIPRETEKEIIDTIKLNRKIIPFRMGVSIFKPYPATELYRQCKENNWISKRKTTSYFEDISILDLPTISYKKIEYYYKIFKLSVYHPILVQFVKILIFIHVYDFLINTLSFFKRLVIPLLSRQQKDMLMRILKI